MKTLHSIPPTLAEWFRIRGREIKSGINCCMPGKIVSFDQATQTASVSLQFMRVTRDVAGQDNKSTDTVTPYQQLVKCPVVFMFGGNASLTFPIAAGDDCLVFFCDRDIDQWYTSGATLPPNTDRLHDLNDGFVLVGVKPATRAISYFNGVKLCMGNAFMTMDASANIEINNGNGVVALEDKIKIAVGTQTLKDILDSLCTALTSWVDSRGDSPNSTTIAAINAVKAKADAVFK